MKVEFDTELRPVLESAGKDLQIHADYISKHDIEARYLKRGFGNSYDFNQAERLEEVF